MNYLYDYNLLARRIENDFPSNPNLGTLTRFMMICGMYY